MANMYNGGPNFKTVEELKNYVDWVAKENNINNETALNAIVNANQVTIQGKKVANREPTDDVVRQLIPERNPVEGEAGYQAPKSFGENMGDALVEGVVDDITGYPKRALWKLATGGYFDGNKVNTKKILDEAGVGKKGTKKIDKETTKPDKKVEEKTSSGLLKFGKDATSIEQIENRDRQLAQILSEKGVTDISKVEKFLNKFDAFKEASDENKQRTINRIMNNINNINSSKQETKQEDEPEVKEEKEELIYNEEGAPVGSRRTPSNDDSINGVEEELIYDKKGNPVGSKAKTKTNDKKDKKKDKKNDAINFIKSSPTMLNLLNSKK